MSEIVAEAKTLYVYMTCDKCGKGLMKPCGCCELLVYPPKYNHKCNKCGYEQVYSEVYPCKKLVPIEEPRKPTDEEMKWIRSD